MPKDTKERIIDRPFVARSNGAIIVGSGGAGGGGTSDHGALSGLADDDHPQYLNTARGDVRYVNQSEFDDISDDVTELQADVSFLEARTVIAAGPGLTSDGVLLGVGNPTVTFDPTTIAGDGLGTTGSGNTEALYVRTGLGLEISSDLVRIDEDADLDWTGDHTFASTLGSDGTFTSGYAGSGSGWRIDTPNNIAIFDNVTVRETLSVYELLVRQIRATNGNLFISSVGKIASVDSILGSSYTVTCEEVHGFAAGDLIKAQRFTGTGTFSSKMTVTAITPDGKGFTATLNSGVQPAAGYEYVRHGSTSDADRQGSIYLASDDDYAPFIDIVDDVSSWAEWDGGTKVKARFGNLAGITDDNMGVLSGYGMWADNVYLNGQLWAADGKTAIDQYGLAMNSVTPGTGWTSTGGRITFKHDSGTPAYDNITWQITGQHYEDGGTIYNSANLEVYAGLETGLGDTGTDVARMDVGVNYLNDTADSNSFIRFWNDSGSAIMYLYLRNQGIGGEMVTVGGSSINPVVIRPQADQYASLGTSSYKFKELHVETLYTGTTSSTDTGHNHNDLYYTEAEVDSLLAGKANATHTHVGYATTIDLLDYALNTDLTNHTGNAALHRTISDGTATATALWSGEYINTQLGTKASTAYVDSAVAGLATDADLTAHTGDTSIHFVINDAADTGSDVVWSVDKLQAELSAVTIDDVALTNVDNNFTTGQTITGGLTASGAIQGASLTTTSGDVKSGRYVIAPDGALFGADSTSATTGSPIGLLLSLTHASGGTTPRLPEYALEVDGTTNLAGGNITLNDYWVIQSSGGQIRSTNPAWSATGGGLMLDPSGEIDAVRIGGSHLTVSAAVFEYQSEIVSGGSQRWTPGGAAVLLEDTQFDPTASSVDVPVEDPEYGHYQRFEVGDIISIVGKFEIQPAESGFIGLTPVWDQVFNAQRLGNAVERNFEIWLKVDDFTDNTTHFTYTCSYARDDRTWTRGSFYAGAGVVGYGADGAPGGYIKIAANESGSSPYMAVYTYDVKPWESSGTVLVGNLSGTKMGQRDEYGIAIGDDILGSSDDPDASKKLSYILASDERIEIQNVPYNLLDEDGDNILRMDDSEGLTLYYKSTAADERRRITIYDSVTNDAVLYLQGAFNEVNAPSATLDGFTGLFSPVNSSNVANLQLAAGDLTGDTIDQYARIYLGANEYGGNISEFSDWHGITTNLLTLQIQQNETGRTSGRMEIDFPLMVLWTQFAREDPGVYRAVYIDENGFLKVSATEPDVPWLPPKWGEPA